MKQRAVLWLALMVIGSPAIAEEIGTTPEGNVIYRFTCPGASPKDIQSAHVEYPKHIGDHPEWDWEYGGYGMTPYVSSTSRRIARGGQVLRCTYNITVNPGNHNLELRYRYKVKREIISCQSASSSNTSMTCILKPNSGGGKRR